MLSILFCYSAPPNDPCINITHTKPIMSRCLSSSVILPPSNPSCPITPPLPCHPVPMSTAVRRALRFRPSSLSSAPRIAFAAVIATTRQRPPPQWDKLGKPAGIEEGSFVSLFLRRFFGFIYILFSFYTPPPLFLSQLLSLSFHYSSLASLRLFGSNGLNDSPFRLDRPFQPKKYKPT